MPAINCPCVGCIIGAHQTQVGVSAKNSTILHNASTTPTPWVEPTSNQPHCAAKHRLSCSNMPTERPGLPFASSLGAITWLGFTFKVCSTCCLLGHTHPALHDSIIYIDTLYMACICHHRGLPFYLILQLQRLTCPAAGYIIRGPPLGVQNGKTRAIEVPAGFRVEVFSRDDFSGMQATYSNGKHDLPADFLLNAMRVARDDVGETGIYGYVIPATIKGEDYTAIM